MVVLVAGLVVATTAGAFRPAAVRGARSLSLANGLANRGPPGAKSVCQSGSVGGSSSRLFASVTGSVYEAQTTTGGGDDEKAVVVTLYTKEGCTLCDKVKDVLSGLRDESVHSLRQIDITDEDQKDSFDRYKYDIPVLHIGCGGGDADDAYWTKHRLTVEEARDAIAEAAEGSFEARKGRPNAAAMER